MIERGYYMDIPAGVELPHVVNAIIEIPKGRRNKFEVDKRTGLIKLDRYLYASAHYPGDYGFIPHTHAEDGDPLDVLVMVNEPTFSGCLIETHVIGLFKMRDRDTNDFKVLGVPHSDPLFEHLRDLKDVPPHFLREVEHFFATYKELEGVEIEVIGWGGAAEATAEVEASVDRFANRLAQRAKEGYRGR